MTNLKCSISNNRVTGIINNRSSSFLSLHPWFNHIYDFLDCLCTVSFIVVTCILSHSLRRAFTSFPLHNQECFTIAIYFSLILGCYDSCCLHRSISLFFSTTSYFVNYASFEGVNSRQKKDRIVRITSTFTTCIFQTFASSSTFLYFFYLHFLGQFQSLLSIIYISNLYIRYISFALITTSYNELLVPTSLSQLILVPKRFSNSKPLSLSCNV